jgi:hypothetical protein
VQVSTRLGTVDQAPWVSLFSLRFVIRFFNSSILSTLLLWFSISSGPFPVDFFTITFEVVFPRIEALPALWEAIVMCEMNINRKEFFNSEQVLNREMKK